MVRPMKEHRIVEQTTLLEDEIRDRASDFSTKYHAVYQLQCLAQRHPATIGPRTISVLEGLLKDPAFSDQRRGFFLFRLAADTLASIIVHCTQHPTRDQAFSALKRVLRETCGHAHRVSAEALGGLPFSVRGPELKEVAINGAPCLTWETILQQTGLRLLSPAAFFGRSLVASLRPGDRLLVLKLALADDSPALLLREALWMDHLRTGDYLFPLRFKVPAPMRIGQGYVFRLKGVPARLPENLALHPKRYAVGFVADKDYFSYPNHCQTKIGNTDREFSQTMVRNAWLLGKLASLGIIHAAPIPLFHNRVQRCRRRDNGLYEWFRGGRLDRWLESCSYPNIGHTGIRDFEHLTSFKGYGRDLYRHVGSHILSLLLVIGSYFRNKDRNRVGFDEHGKPVDARDLFDKEFLKASVWAVFFSYYWGFAGGAFRGEIPLDMDKLAGRMIEEMGIDRHMEEILRAADQRGMSDDEFGLFLKQRGFSDGEIDGLERGAEDIVVPTGPHLGGFNEGISLPELTEAVETMSALCMAGKYSRQQVQSCLGR
jgi:hypothetical protein